MHPTFLAECFDCDRTTVLHGINTAQRLAKANDKEMVNSLIFVNDLIMELKFELYGDFEEEYAMYIENELVKRLDKLVEEKSLPKDRVKFILKNVISKFSEQQVDNNEQ